MTSQSDPVRAEKLYRYALSLKREGLLEQALGAYDALVDLLPDSAEAHNNRGNLLDELGRFEEAVADFARAVELKPDYAEAHNNHGVAMMHMYRYDEALASYARALALKEDYAEAHSNRGNTLKELGRLDDALASYDRALALKGDDRDAAFNKSLALLLAGRYQEGWPLYEWRWAQKNHEAKRRDFGRPLWLGQADLAGKTILLWSEQGFGDTIQFCRYATLVGRQGARVILQVDEALVDLLRTLDGVDQVLGPQGALPSFDFHCPLLSLPLAFNTDARSIPAMPGYLRADGARIERWRRKLGPKNRPRVGIVWSGAPKFGDDAKRSATLAGFLTALPGDGLEIICLHKEVKPQDAAMLSSLPAVRVVAEQLASFADTAALVDQLDLVIAVDTAVAHLGGAMGKPTWILLPHVSEWRWLMERRDSPWYPTARLYRQPSFGAWAEVFAAVKADLRALYL